MDEHRGLHIRQVHDLPQARRVPVGEGLRIVVEIHGAGVDRVSITGTRHADIEEAREPWLARERPMAVARDVRLAPFQVAAVACLEILQRAFQRIDEQALAAFRLRGANVVAPVRLGGKHIAHEDRARGPVGTERVAELVGVERAREFTPPRGHDERLRAVSRHARVPRGQLLHDFMIGIRRRKSR
jgi:hypothetical protein